ncbi:MFS transporter [Paraburkholderia caballeronis]|uniref:MFS transporter, putative metabolite:H+ symporter n=1 Tax=Paraburkholderia caballeronis TaxID=416943 RepID=A0A1H7F1D0_9BURK|nr:MFS transporter [Paraburkholderia caballeronis]PXW23907.1 putative MFS transporter [Paraburkholderia caballeronis]PXW99671.1 putative MFS transporter [Paraburkholderia caballeronis]RAJ96625.1 putative MFS transporter [Paraburkholderia caballeronis]TDV33685.1 putative MFS transporter [Paraburkholderia caballeronis]SEE78890.1 MFS transporter, putative metabolite:H+ symporter [Paraburkholderia caballeronis]
MHADASIGARLDRLPLSGFHWRLLGLIAAGMYFDSFDIYIAGTVLAAMIHSGESTLSQNAMFVSVTFIGMMTGAWLSGWLGDRFGRRFCYQFNLGIYGFASIAGALAPSIDWLIFFRLVMGIGMGAEIVVGYGTLSEFIPASWRGRFGTVLNLIINTSLFLSTFLGWLIVPQYGWRWMFAIAGCGALFVWFLRKSMPESPRWLAEHGRGEEALRIVERIETECGTTPAQAATPAPAPIAAGSEGRMADLFSRRLLARTITAVVVLVALFVVNYAFVSWIPTFLVKQGHSVSSSLGLTAVMFAGGPVGSLVAFFLAERLGRKWGIVLFSLVCAGFGVAYPFAQSATAIAALGFAITACIYVLSSFSVATYVPELFPTGLRLRGSGLANTVGRGVSIFVPFAVAGAFTRFGIAGVLTLIVGTLLAQALIVGLLGTETRRRSLESIAADIAGTDGAQKEGGAGDAAAAVVE